MLPEINELGADFWVAIGRLLTDRERAVILGVYRDGLQLVELAERLGVSKVRVGQLHHAALERLRRREELRELVGSA